MQVVIDMELLFGALQSAPHQLLLQLLLAFLCNLVFVGAIFRLLHCFVGGVFVNGAMGLTGEGHGFFMPSRFDNGSPPPEHAKIASILNADDFKS